MWKAARRAASRHRRGQAAYRPVAAEVLEARTLLSGVGISSDALALVNQRSTFNQEVFYVYQDADSPFNHGFPSGLFADAGSSPGDLVSVRAASVYDPAAPNGTSVDGTVVDQQRGTVLRVDFAPLGPGQFAGLIVEDPEGFVAAPRGVGYDLSGATNIMFEAWSPSPGGVRVQFGVEDHTTGFVHLGSQPQPFSISLAALGLTPAELQNVQKLFSVATNDLNAAAGGTVMLDEIRFDPVPVAQTTALGLPVGTETFGVVASPASPIPPDQAVRNLSTTYEASLAIHALLDRGSQEDLAGARLIADTLLYALAHDLTPPHQGGLGLPPAADGSRGLHDGYFAGDIATHNDQGGGGAQAGQVRLAGFSVPDAMQQHAGFFLVQDGATGGNNAFGVMGLLAAYRRFHDTRYLDGAREIGRWIVDVLKDTSGTGFGGYYFGFNEGGENPRVLQRAKSIENNADIFAAFSMLSAIEQERGNAADAEAWATHAAHAGDFVMEMYDPVRGRFHAGTVFNPTGPGPGLTPDGPQRGGDVVNTFDFLDSNSFTTLALARAPRYRDQIDWRRPMQYVIDNFAKEITANGRAFEGFSIVKEPVADIHRPQAGADGIAWEFTAQAVVMMRFVDRLYGESRFEADAQHYLQQIRDAQSFAPFGDGLGLVAATLDGENEHASPYAAVDQCLTTPFQCIPERVGLAATTWAVFADRDVNLFAPQWDLPATQIGQTFVVDDWNNTVTRNDLGFNYFSGNTGTTESVENTTDLKLSGESNGDAGGSLEVRFDFTGQPAEVFAGYFASLFGLTDTFVSLDGTGAQPPTTTQFPGYALDVQNVFGDLSPGAAHSLEQIQFDVRLETAADVTIKIELQDETGFDVFTRRTITPTGNDWNTVSLAIPDGFDDSVSGNGDVSAFNWNEVSTFSLIIERNNVGAGVANPDAGVFLIDNLQLVDADGAYPDLELARNPDTGELHHLYEESFLDLVRRASARYFVDFASTDPRTGGIIQDRSSFADLMSVGGVGFQLTSYVIDAQQQYLSRPDAAVRVRDVLRALDDTPQGPGRTGTNGYQGFFYHFLGIDGKRKQNFDFDATPLDESLNTVELSTIDTALAVAGIVTAGQYFDGDHPDEVEIRRRAHDLYSAVNWKFMLDDERFTDTKQFFLGWKPNEPRDDDSGRYGRFKLDDDPVAPQGQYSSKPDAMSVEVPATIDFYTDEGLLIALLAMGSPNPDHRLGRDVWDAMIRDNGGGDFIKTFPGALFTYQFASVWLDTAALGTDNHPTTPVDFFVNTRDAITATREYATANPNNRATWQAGAGETRWGLNAAEGPYDVYFANAAPTAALAIDAGIRGPAMFVAEAEQGSGDGSPAFRGNASAGETVQLDAGESRTVGITVDAAADYDVTVRYSNDNFGPLETITIVVDGTVAGAFLAQDTGNGGAGWNVFVEGTLTAAVPLGPGPHTVEVQVSGGDGLGVELDTITLGRGEILLPLEVGTTTVYGAASSIVHASGHAIAALWEAYNLGLLHDRFGFADAFNLDITDVTLPEEPGSAILRTDGSWANHTGFGIDHGPMLAMIDNYLTGGFVPGVFMSHPGVSAALGTLFPDYTPQPAELAAPEIFAPPALTFDPTPTVAWQDLAGALNYDLELYSVDQGSLLLRSLDSDGTEFTPDDALLPGNYQVFVRGADVLGSRGPWGMRTFAIPNSSGLPVLEFIDVAATSTDPTPTLSWLADPPAPRYHFELYSIDQGRLLVREEQLTTTSYTVTAPLATGSYQAFVRTIDTDGLAGEWAQTAFFVHSPIDPPAPPVFNGPFGQTGDTTPLIHWQPVSGAVAYDLLLYSVSRGQLITSLAGTPQTGFTPQTPLPRDRYQVFVRGLTDSALPGPWGRLEFEVVMSIAPGVNTGGEPEPEVDRDPGAAAPFEKRDVDGALVIATDFRNPAGEVPASLPLQLASDPHSRPAEPAGAEHAIDEPAIDALFVDWPERTDEAFRDLPVAATAGIGVAGLLVATGSATPPDPMGSNEIRRRRGRVPGRRRAIPPDRLRGPVGTGSSD